MDAKNRIGTNPDPEIPGNGGPTDNHKPTSNLPEPVPAVRQPRKLDLTLAAVPVIGDIQPITQLGVCELKGVGQMFTANMDLAYQFRGVVYKPVGSYETHYQLIAGGLLNAPQIVRLTQMIAFVPCFSWATLEIVLYPVKMTTYGQKVLADLSKLRPEFPQYKVFVQWDDTKRRHVVYRQLLSASEGDLINKAVWPDSEAVIAALELTAYDTVDALCVANDDIRTLLSAKEV